jgi:hypothetical protein
MRLTKAHMSPALREALDKLKGYQMKPEEIEAQRQSWIKAMAPCEHGDPDWETCPECRKASGFGDR